MSIFNRLSEGFVGDKIQESREVEDETVGGPGIRVDVEETDQSY